MHIIISSQNPEPLYRQIVEQMQKQILLGELQPHQPLPSIRQLARDLMTSVITTKRAYEDLEREGFIYTRVGKGTFVAELDKTARRKEILASVKERLQDLLQEAAAAGITPDELEQLWWDLSGEKGE